ncbi:MAG: His/Gly/Thr/Pro-type tRNA ligase C-terminal domain-containing protein, partial [Calditrichia bacterium]
PLGTHERMIGFLIEHYAGAFPVWLAPVQAIILPITDRHHEFSKKVLDEFRAKNIRTEIDLRNEKVGFKIREAEVQKIPYMIVIGDKEVEGNEISVRHKGEGNLGAMSLTQFLSRITGEMKSKKN